MKTVCQILLLILLSTPIIAQKAMEAGYIKMEVTEVFSEDEQKAAGANMFKGSETEYFFDKEHTLVKQNMMGGMVTIRSLMNLDTEEIEMYFEMLDQKMFIETNKAEMNTGKDSLTQNKPIKELNISYNKSDTKNILGYNCYKAKISSLDSPIIESLYISEEINVDSKMIQALSDLEINGFPLELTMNLNGIKLVFTTTEIENQLDKNIFQIDDTGFKQMTFKEFQNTISQMSGGLGF